MKKHLTRVAIYASLSMHIYYNYWLVNMLNAQQDYLAAVDTAVRVLLSIESRRSAPHD